MPQEGAGRVRARATLCGLLVVPLALGACSAASNSPLASTSPPPASIRPTPSAAPSATASATTPYDGIWASKPLTRADMAAALARRGQSDAQLDEWFGDWDKLDYRVLEIEIRDGRWLLYENGQGVPFGIGWAGDLALVDADTIVAKDDENQCPVTYDLSRDGDTMSVHVADDACADPIDLPIQVAIYESSPFQLVQPVDWAPPAALPVPSSSPGAPATRPPSTSHARQTLHPIGTVDGAPLGYVEYLPPDYGKQPSPLLVFLHGSGESGTGDERALAVLARSGVPSLIASDAWADERPFVVLAPQHEEDPPSFCMEASEIDAFLHFALEHYDVDPSRVYLTGLSCGAIGVWNYLAAYGDQVVAAAVPIAGYGIGAVQLAGCSLARVPIWAFHGSADENVPVRGDVYPLTTLQGCTDPAPVELRMQVYRDQGHDVWTETYLAPQYDVYGWLLGHHK